MFACAWSKVEVKNVIRPCLFQFKANSSMVVILRCELVLARYSSPCPEKRILVLGSWYSCERCNRPYRHISYMYSTYLRMVRPQIVLFLQYISLLRSYSVCFCRTLEGEGSSCGRHSSEARTLGEGSQGVILARKVILNQYISLSLNVFVIFIIKFPFKNKNKRLVLLCICASFHTYSTYVHDGHGTFVDKVFILVSVKITVWTRSMCIELSLH